MKDRSTIYAVEGDTWQWVFQVKDGAGAAFDFGSQTAVMQLRRAIGDATPFADLSVGNGITMDMAIDNVEVGSITVRVPSDVTAGLCRGSLSIEVLTELKLRDASDPPVVTTLSALRIVVMRAGTKVTA